MFPRTSQVGPQAQFSTVAAVQYAAFVNSALRRSWLIKSGLLTYVAASLTGIGGNMLVVMDGSVVIVVLEGVDGEVSLKAGSAEGLCCRGFIRSKGAALVRVKKGAAQARSVTQVAGNRVALMFVSIVDESSKERTV